MFLLWTVRVPVESCDVTLVPAAFALDATVIQKAARDELDSIDEKVPMLNAMSIDKPRQSTA